MKDLKERTRKFALSVIGMTDAIPRDRVGDVIGRQLLRCGTSVGANCRAACRARSNADFIAKLGIVEEELDESLYWMELLQQSNRMRPEQLAVIRDESNPLLSIIVASIKTAKKNP